MLPILTTLLVGSVSSSPPLPQNIHLAAWNASTGALLNSWTTPPFRALFGAQPTNVSATLVRTPPKTACTGFEQRWVGNAILGGDWTTPGCSIQVRAKNFQAGGAVAAIFQGTEGLPFDWDGSDVSGIHIAVVIVRTKDYKQLDNLAIASGTTPLAIAFKPADTPLLLDPIFVATERTIQIVFLLAAVYIIGLAVYQLLCFRRLAKQTGSAQNKHAIRVITCELIAMMSMLIFIIDGPYQEHTRPCVLPWLVHRVSFSLHVEFHLLGALFFYWHLQQIRKSVERSSTMRTKRRASLRRLSLGSVVSNFLHGRHNELNCCGEKEPDKNEPDKNESDKNESEATLFSAPSTSLIFVCTIVICLLSDFASAVLVGLFFSAGEDFTLFSTALLSLVSFSVGAWFAYQAVMIVRALQEAEKNGAKSGQSIASKLSKNASRNGVSMMLSILLGVLNEFMRIILVDEGGMLYWWVLLPLWAMFLLMLLLTSFFQITAFQTPASKTVSSNSRKVSVVSIQSKKENDGVMRGSGMRGSHLSTCSDAPSAETRHA